MMKNNTAKIELYADLHCPYAYLTAYRLRKLRDDYEGQVTIVHRSLSLEYVNRRPTPKTILDEETPILMLEEPDIPYRPWKRDLTHWPVTMWPAFEAVKCAEKQAAAYANDLDWAIRKAFFADNRCISMRHVLLDLAQDVGLDMNRFTEDFDSGSTKHQVLHETRTGWEELKVEGSPTFVLPSGQQFSFLALPKVKLDRLQNHRAAALEPASCSRDDCLDTYRQLFEQAINEAKQMEVPQLAVNGLYL